MPAPVNAMADTIRILVATDNHVGYNERDPIRGDDSWQTFHEIMCLAKDRDVDMVLLGGDLFHDNVPSRKSLYNVMRSLRLNCYGDKPCEVELLSDGTEHFDATIGHANYEDENVNVAIPVFSIHGNHDDPSGDGHFAALDILEMSGLLNYFGRVPQSDEIQVKPLLLQKGGTKLALYGISNVRDERMYRTFRDGKVKFHQPSVQPHDWYNIAVVHQNHHAHGATSYLPENFLPDMLDLVIWGHEHECIIEPRENGEMGFKVMQPGSSIATSLAPGEAVQKHVAILSVTGRDMQSEPIPLKTVRPFVYKEIVLANEKEARKIAQKRDYQPQLTKWLMAKVDQLIEEAHQQWHEAQEAHPDSDPASSPPEPPLPLVRLRVEHSFPDGAGKFDVENPQRFSNRFSGRVANSHDVVQFHVKKRNAAVGRLRATEELKELMARPEEAENVKVAKLVQEFLAAQALTILPQNCFGDAVSRYIDKDDKHAMDLFINDSLVEQIKNLVSMNKDAEDAEDEDLTAQFDAYKAQMEEMFSKGLLKNRPGRVRYKPRPDNWNSDLDGPWEDQPGAMIMEERSDDGFEDSRDATPEPTAAMRGRGRGRGGRGAAASTRGRGGAAAKKSAPKTTTTTRGRGKKKAPSESESEEEVEDVIMLDDDDDNENGLSNAADSDSQTMFFPDTKKDSKKPTPTTSARGSRAGSVVSSTTMKPATARKAAATTTRKTPARAAASRATKQSQLTFSTSQASVFGGKSHHDGSDIEDDDDDAFEPVSTATKRKR